MTDEPPRGRPLADAFAPAAIRRPTLADALRAERGVKLASLGLSDEMLKGIANVPNIKIPTVPAELLASMGPSKATLKAFSDAAEVAARFKALDIGKIAGAGLVPEHMKALGEAVSQTAATRLAIAELAETERHRRVASHNDFRPPPMPAPRRDRSGEMVQLMEALVEKADMEHARAEATVALMQELVAEVTEANDRTEAAEKRADKAGRRMWIATVIGLALAAVGVTATIVALI